MTKGLKPYAKIYCIKSFIIEVKVEVIQSKPLGFIQGSEVWDYILQNT